MKRGKYERIFPKCRKKKRAARPLILALLVLSIGVGGTLAYMIAQTQDITNAFVPGDVSCQVTESNGEFSVKNIGNVKAYIRAVVVVNWMDSSGNVYGTPPVCTITPNDGWSYDSTTDIYYYNAAVDSQAATTTAPATVICSQDAPSGYSLVIEVVAEAIQAEGMGASSAQDAWAAVTHPNN